MSKPPLRLPPAVVIPIILACLALVIGAVSFVIPFTVASQAYLIIALLLGFRYWPPMIRWVTSMPVPHRVVFGLIIGSMIIGHFTLNARKYFPFVAWEIFAFQREEDPVTCREMIATTASGKEVRLLVEQLFPSIVQIYPLNDTAHYPPDKLDHLIQAVAKTYNERHANDPVIAVNLVEIAVKLHPTADESLRPPSCALLKHYDFSSGL